MGSGDCLRRIQRTGLAYWLARFLLHPAANNALLSGGQSQATTQAQINMRIKPHQVIHMRTSRSNFDKRRNVTFHPFDYYAQLQSSCRFGWLFLDHLTIDKIGYQ